MTPLTAPRITRITKTDRGPSRFVAAAVPSSQTATWIVSSVCQIPQYDGPVQCRERRHQGLFLRHARNRILIDQRWRCGRHRGRADHLQFRL